MCNKNTMGFVCLSSRVQHISGLVIRLDVRRSALIDCMKNSIRERYWKPKVVTFGSFSQRSSRTLSLAGDWLWTLKSSLTMNYCKADLV